MSETKPRIGLILGSSSDMKLVQKCRDRIKAFGEPFEMIVASAHRTPNLVRDWTEGAEERGLRVIIAAAGAAAALPGVVAAHTALPVVGLPLDSTSLRGTDALYSIVQMPPGMPVATVGINNAENAALMALQILAAFDPAVKRKVMDYRQSLRDKVNQANQDLYEEDPELRPAMRELGAQGAAGRVIEVREPIRECVAPAPSPRRARIDLLDPDPDLFERAKDVLIDGGIVALPTDTVYGLAVDASRPQAVEKLFAAKNRDTKKAIALLISSREMLERIASEMPEALEPALERFWPGPLTVVLKKFTRAFRDAAPGDTVGVRIPRCAVALGLLRLMSRPLAVTSANLSDEDPARDAETIERTFGDAVDLILDAGPLQPGPVSTVLDASVSPFRILRQHGAVSDAALKAALGDHLIL
ncbi:MAG: N5-carboxyaminoimidazole ribonucleotide mutase [candidate division BRC1 bacterium ADurb.BinA364]|nr:MAG: N5-carboxyaminoimidazole ribonucleotide mutase [candidate division BRC1 bacterium ADurb.BinA364]